MFGFGKQNAAIDAFAVEIVQNLSRRFPQSREAELGGDKKKAGKTLGNALTEMQSKLIQFQDDNKLGVYGKARLLRSVQSELRRLHYSDTFVQAITELLVPATAAKIR
jgi:hypothetical protein